MSLLDTASLIVTPNGYKEGTLYSVIPTNGAGDMSVVRATTATRVNSSGLVELVPYNLLTWSEQIDNADWLKSNSPTITTNIAIAPNGTMTADGIQSPSGTNYKVIYQTKTIAPNSTLTYSLYVKKETSETNFGGIGMYLSGGSIKSFYVIINAVTGTLVLTANSITPTLQVVDAGAYWRIITTVIDDGNNTSVIAEYYATISTNGTSLAPASGSVRTLWGFQLNEGTIKDYQKTETRLNIPRLDYSNGTCPSLLVEPQRTNLITYSQDFTNASYFPAGVIVAAPTITANQTISPDGNQNADKIVIPAVSSVGSVSVVYRNPIFLSGANSTSIYLKGQSGGEKVYLFYIVGTTYENKLCTLTTEWQRFDLTFTGGAVSYWHLGVDLRVGSGQSAQSAQTFFAYGAQLEAGAYPTSYIPTTSASVTRNADVVSKTGISSLIGQTEGTCFIDINIDSSFAEADMRFINVSDGTSANWYFIGTNNANQFRFFYRASATTYVSITTALTSGRHKLAFAYKLNDYVAYLDGTQVNNTTTLVVGSTSQIELGNAFGFNIAKEYTNASALWKTRLTNTQLAQLTTI